MVSPCGFSDFKSGWHVKYKPVRLSKRLREKHGYAIDVVPLPDRAVGWRLGRGRGLGAAIKHLVTFTFG
ncbi:MAG: hypothetical protein IPJ79_15550 [Bacteroidetes bacterium]|nr:hypothetical protein [Bacteroidota bacterium]